jgi:hypothetical protein
MLPSGITASQFQDYPPEARQLAVAHIDVLRRLPLTLAPLLLQQVEQFDWKFPVERRKIDGQLSYLSSRSEEQLSRLVSGFERLKVSPRLESFDWVESPTGFSEALSAFLWSSGQIDAFTSAAEKFMQQVDAALPAQRPEIPRLGIAVIGQGVEVSKMPLFRKLRPYGTTFTQVRPSGGLQILLDAVAARAAAHPVPYGHWYVDGGLVEGAPNPHLATISYEALQPVREALLKKITRAIQGGIGGPEALSHMLSMMRPEDIGLPGGPQQEVFSHFVTSVFTGGQGTQIFSTSFVQWTARELWQRAQPLTLLARFTPRQRERSMNELLSGKDTHPQTDPQGSLIDADMGAYLMWIDQQRLAAANEAAFLVWFEDHNQALAVSPRLPRGTESGSPVDMTWLLLQTGVKELKPASEGKRAQPRPASTAAVRPRRNNDVVDRIDRNEDNLDFLNEANYGNAANVIDD